MINARVDSSLPRECSPSDDARGGRRWASDPACTAPLLPFPDSQQLESSTQAGSCERCDMGLGRGHCNDGRCHAEIAPIWPLARRTWAARAPAVTGDRPDTQRPGSNKAGHTQSPHLPALCLLQGFCCNACDDLHHGESRWGGWRGVLLGWLPVREPRSSLWSAQIGLAGLRTGI